MMYLIWATDKRAWWRPDREGYTRVVGEAGDYSGEEVADILSNDMLNNQRVCHAGVLAANVMANRMSAEVNA